jgi:hypothetical protein
MKKKPISQTIYPDGIPSGEKFGKPTLKLVIWQFLGQNYNIIAILIIILVISMILSFIKPSLQISVIACILNLFSFGLGLKATKKRKIKYN